MNKKTYLKGNRSVEIEEIKTGIKIMFFITSIMTNYHFAPCLNNEERKSIFQFLNA